jgi:hypothetical protein
MQHRFLCNLILLPDPLSKDCRGLVEFINKPGKTTSIGKISVSFQSRYFHGPAHFNMPVSLSFPGLKVHEFGTCCRNFCELCAFWRKVGTYGIYRNSFASLSKTNAVGGSSGALAEAPSHAIYITKPICLIPVIKCGRITEGFGYVCEGKGYTYAASYIPTRNLAI